jgi:hypothetical protein
LWHISIRHIIVKFVQFCLRIQTSPLVRSLLFCPVLQHACLCYSSFVFSALVFERAGTPQQAIAVPEATGGADCGQGGAVVDGHASVSSL